MKMKTMQVVRDSKGKVTATAELALGDEVPVSVELEQGQNLEEIEVPDNYILDQMKTMQVVRDSKGKVVGTAELAQGDEVPVSVELEQGQNLEDIEVPGNYIFELGAFFDRESKTKKP